MYSPEIFAILNASVVGKDFLDHTEHPEIDKFLDYRLALMTEKKISLHLKQWLEIEIEAVDQIITILQDKDNQTALGGFI